MKIKLNIMIVAIVTIITGGIAVIELIQATLNKNTNFVRIFSTWKPNAMNGMHSRYIGCPGLTKTRQYAMTLGRDTGPIEVKPNLILNEINDLKYNLEVFHVLSIL
jgi:hypothetical protein